MRHVTPEILFAACRFGIVSAAGGRFQGQYRTDPISRTAPSVSEFALPGGEVIARKVVAEGGDTLCWLRADLADLAERALADEQELNARIAAEISQWSRDRDQRRADEQGVSLEQFRNKRNHALARIDQRRGRNSVGLG